MKKNILTTILLLLATISESQNLLPAGNCTYNIGSPALNWQDLYLCNNIYIDNDRFLSNGGGTNSAYVGRFAGFASGAAAIQNVATGYYALGYNTTGDYNTATGAFALLNNTASRTTATGYAALYNNTTGSYNTAHGFDALYSNTSGYYNTANGYQAAFNNTTGYSNTVMGYQALFNNGITTGSYNTAIGVKAMYQNNGFYNTAVGISAGEDNSNYSTFLGWGARGVAGVSNSAAIGYDAFVNANDKVVIGNTAVSTIGGYANWTMYISDGRFKKSQKENVPGLEFIKQLRPVTYTLDLLALNKSIVAGAVRPGNDGIAGDIKSGDDLAKAQDAKSKIIYTGFIAQEVEAAAKKINYDFSGVKKPDNDNDLYGIRYAEFVVPLVKAVQELAVANDEKDKKIEKLEAEIEQLKNLVSQNNNNVNSKIYNGLTVNETALLGQNIPNPFKGTTLIPFRLPNEYRLGSIIITEASSGRLLKTIPVTSAQKNISVTLRGYASGTYIYSLIVNGKTVDTKKMIITQ